MKKKLRHSLGNYSFCDTYIHHWRVIQIGILARHVVKFGSWSADSWILKNNTLRTACDAGVLNGDETGTYGGKRRRIQEIQGSKQPKSGNIDIRGASSQNTPLLSKCCERRGGVFWLNVPKNLKIFPAFGRSGHEKKILAKDRPKMRFRGCRRWCFSGSWQLLQQSSFYMARSAPSWVFSRSVTFLVILTTFAKLHFLWSKRKPGEFFQIRLRIWWCW